MGNAASFNAEEVFAERMTAVITGLMRFRNLTRHDVMRALHISQGTYYKRLSDGHWTARQMQLLAEMLGVSVDDLYRDPAKIELDVGGQKAKFLTLVPGGPGARNVQGVLPFGRHLRPVGRTQPTAAP